MKRIGIVSYNIYGNFTNYGSALQSWALHQKISDLGHVPILVDYCPDVLADKDQLNPFKNMWDKDAESLRMCELSMPAIRENYFKFDRFYTERFNRTHKKYTSLNFNEVMTDEKLQGFVCGSDTIFCMDEFGIDDGFYANYECMKKHSVAYAASFGDPTLTEENRSIVADRLGNFLAIGLRENLMIPFSNECVSVPIQRVADPTLLFDSDKYDEISEKRIISDKYLLYYSRRYSPAMEEYAERIAKDNGWEIVDISLRATNIDKGHRMFYEAGVEEFISLVKHAEYVVTNSFHGMIFAVQYRKEFVIFSRHQCNNKIDEMTELLGLTDRIMQDGNESISDTIDYDIVHQRIADIRENSIKFLRSELELL